MGEVADGSDPGQTPAKKSGSPRVAIIMGSRSDWPTMEHAADILEELGVAAECRVVSAHRTPGRLYEFARSAKDKGYQVIIAGAGGAAHLPGMTASMTTLPVLGVPVKSSNLDGFDSLLSIVQMPAEFPWELWRLAMRARSTPVCWRRRSLRSKTLTLQIASMRGATGRPPNC